MILRKFPKIAEEAKRITGLNDLRDIQRLLMFCSDGKEEEYCAWMNGIQKFVKKIEPFGRDLTEEGKLLAKQVAEICYPILVSTSGRAEWLYFLWYVGKILKLDYGKIEGHKMQFELKS